MAKPSTDTWTAELGWLLLLVACALGISFGIGGFNAVLMNGSFDLSFGPDLSAAVAGTAFGVVSVILLRKRQRRRAWIPSPVLVATALVCLFACVYGFTVHVPTDIARPGLSEFALIGTAECFFVWGVLASGYALYKRRRSGASADLPVADQRP
ncbi:MAG TPA: hypothetical protein VFX16_18575 [Pseudonocardiaceae bacterium]|nr:hypothetical protein [Pseudonocardiaceae bacterium]